MRPCAQDQSGYKRHKTYKYIQWQLFTFFVYSLVVSFSSVSVNKSLTKSRSALQYTHLDVISLKVGLAFQGMSVAFMLAIFHGHVASIGVGNSVDLFCRIFPVCVFAKI